VQHYILDNEPSIWHSTHRDVHPTGATMDEVRDKIVEYSGMIKALDPSAIVSAPEEWGWSGYFYSGYDQQYGSTHGWSVLPDRNNHGGPDYLPWLLDQLRQQQSAGGRRLVDVLTVHYYPQGGEFSDDVSNAMQLRRNRSTRSLWDPNYVDETWINDRARLVPRLTGWVNTYYPGTSIGITEYNWGAEDHINGATTQADVLGIFGREGLDMAARWTTPAASTRTYKAMKMYRNYDGGKSSFGDTSVAAAAAPNPDAVSVFAAQRTSDGAVTVMVISKQLKGTTPATIALANFPNRLTAKAWQLTSANAIHYPWCRRTPYRRAPQPTCAFCSKSDSTGTPEPFSAQRASGLSRNCTWLMKPRFLSVWTSPSVLFDTHRPRPFQPAFASSMRPSSPRVNMPRGYGVRMIVNFSVPGLNTSSESELVPVRITMSLPSPSVLNWSTQM
jgi:hypothetical protein